MMAMIRNGTKIRRPISKARFSSDSVNFFIGPKAAVKVAIANPTYCAVARKHESGKMEAPVCVAKAVAQIISYVMRNKGQLARNFKGAVRIKRVAR
jgi:hypothetical protein